MSEEDLPHGLTLEDQKREAVLHLKDIHNQSEQNKIDLHSNERLVITVVEVTEECIKNILLNRRSSKFGKM